MNPEVNLRMVSTTRCLATIAATRPLDKADSPGCVGLGLLFIITSHHMEKTEAGLKGLYIREIALK